jgi:Pyridoxamine 5'-phosphate oxidase
MLQSPLTLVFYLLCVGVATDTDNNDIDCPCGDFVFKRPDLWKKAETARWMVHTIDYGVLTTISSRLPPGSPFGNAYSFVDGSCANATGTPYFYGTYIDQSFQDMVHNPAASLTLTEASLVSSSCPGRSDKYLDKACSITHTSSHVGDPENPVCARLTVSGTLEPLVAGTAEYDTMQAAFYQRHPQMQLWPADHGWVIAKLIVQDIWLIDYFGGAAILTPEQYYGAELAAPMADENT